MSSATRGELARVRARLLLTRGLGLLPQRAVGAVRDRYGRSGEPGALLRSAVAVLRHRTLAPLTDFALYDNPGVRLVAVDSRLLRLLYWYGQHGYEGAEVDLWRLFCSRARRIVEIGANVGYYTVQGASAGPTADYVAVEAHPDSADILRRNLALNGLHRVEVVQAAALGTADVAEVELALPDLEVYAAPTGAYVSRGGEGVPGYRPAHRTVRVPVVAATQLVAGADLLKLDIEGMEADVLEPVLPTLLKVRPTLFVEVLRQSPRLRAVLVGLLHADYLLAVICPAGLTELDEQQLSTADLMTAFGGRDVIALPRERSDLLRPAQAIARQRRHTAPAS